MSVLLDRFIRVSCNRLDLLADFDLVGFVSLFIVDCSQFISLLFDDYHGGRLVFLVIIAINPNRYRLGFYLLYSGRMLAACLIIVCWLFCCWI